MQNQRSTPGFNQAQDQRLIERMVQREESALSGLYDRYSRLIYGFVLRVVGDTAEAEEVVLDVFWQTWHQAAQYNAERGTVLTWIMTIARTRAIDRRRRLDRQVPTADITEEEHNPLAEPPPAIEERLFLASQRERVKAAVASLTEPQRRAIELAYYEGLSQSEIAAALAKPLGTVKTHIRTGLAHLRERLGSCSL